MAVGQAQLVEGNGIAKTPEMRRVARTSQNWNAANMGEQFLRRMFPGLEFHTAVEHGEGLEPGVITLTVYRKHGLGTTGDIDKLFDLEEGADRFVSEHTLTKVMLVAGK